MINPLVEWHLAGWLGSHWGSHWRNTPFLYGSLIGLVLLSLVQLMLSPTQQGHTQGGDWHEHEHIHDQFHQHTHHQGISLDEPHIHPHQHTSNSHKLLTL